MKETRSFIRSLLVCGVTLAVVASVSAEATKQESARVIHMKGQVRVVHPNGNQHLLQVGAILNPGDVVQTAMEKGSYVDIFLGRGAGAFAMPMPVAGPQSRPSAGGGGRGARADQNVVRLWENTILAIDRLLSVETDKAVVTETLLDLRQGHILGNVKKMTAGSKYEIKYPNGVAGIRGSAYDMKLAQQTVNGQVKVQATLMMQSGSAVLSFYDNQGNLVTQTVPPLQSFSTETGVMAPIPSGTLVQISDLLRDIRPGPGVVIPPSSPTPIEILQPVVTTTTGSTTPPTPDTVGR